jgi:hypothetical protein
VILVDCGYPVLVLLPREENLNRIATIGEGQLKEESLNRIATIGLTHLREENLNRIATIG